MTVCCWVVSSSHVKGWCCLHLQLQAVQDDSLPLKMKAMQSSDMSQTNNKMTQHHILQNLRMLYDNIKSCIHTHCCIVDGYVYVWYGYVCMCGIVTVRLNGYEGIVLVWLYW
jgi:hypothetical protein